MCLLVFVGTARPLAETGRPAQPDPERGYACVERVADDAPVRAHFRQPCVSYVGSHQGCGCGFQSDDYLFGELSPADALALAEALAPDERRDLTDEQRSRERLRDLVVAALADGDVELYACWAGDEAAPTIDTCEVAAGHVTAHLRPLAERVLYLVRGADR